MLVTDKGLCSVLKERVKEASRQKKPKKGETF